MDRFHIFPLNSSSCDCIHILLGEDTAYLINDIFNKDFLTNATNVYELNGCVACTKTIIKGADTYACCCPK